MYPYQRTPSWEIPIFSPYKYHGYTVRGTPNCPLIVVLLDQIDLLYIVGIVGIQSIPSPVLFIVFFFWYLDGWSHVVYVILPYFTHQKVP